MYRGSGGDHAQILHKTDVGGVSLNLASEEAVRREVERLHAKFSAQGIEYHGILVSEMLPKGREHRGGQAIAAAFEVSRDDGGVGEKEGESREGNWDFRR